MKRFVRLFATVLLIASTLLAEDLLAQSTGSVYGHVTDSSGSILQGAQVQLQPTSVIVITDAQGAYFINDIAPGTYTLAISYVGFTLFTQTIDVTPGKNLTVDAKMQVSSQKDEILKTEHAQNLKDADELVELSTELRDSLNKNDRYVLSLSDLKKTDDIEKLIKKIRTRLRRN